ncbi:putative ATP-dependent helicase C17A2.12 [Lasiodiplodia hormozganensis]|uniref:ATP-dependent helicase C17A2.12 n=1 Tax=Lasiodiplodia hormozganensis TaxID=869390 RepID=A0AA39WHC9_9PEZI|nr:putative ATP-dependent helicase C17A2.12 [Lasiodiplodia hormozganensis]
MIQSALSKANIRNIRIDGKVSAQARQRILQCFRREKDITVALLTTDCGAVGLDLTVASRAHLLEPHWNPSLEEQALARVHRLGQHRSVTTIRYIMKDSFEQSIITVQDRKKFLASVLLSKRDPT